MTASRQKQSPGARTGLHTHIGRYRMVPQLIARIDGLPEVLLGRQVVWPVPANLAAGTASSTPVPVSPSAAANRRSDRTAHSLCSTVLGA